MDGAMMEVGPYRVTEDGNLKYNNGSWDEFANLLFVDQPVGTGFSYVNTDSYLSELDQMAEHMVIFLEKWFALFPEYEHDDVSPFRPNFPSRQRLTAAVLHCRRILRRPAHPTHRTRNPQTQQAGRHSPLAAQGPAHREWLDLARRPIPRISSLRLPERPDQGRV